MSRSKPNPTTDRLTIPPAEPGYQLSASKQLNPTFQAVEQLVNDNIPVRADGDPLVKFLEAVEMAGYKWSVDKTNSIEKKSRRQMWDRRDDEKDYKFASDNPELVSKVTMSPHEVMMPKERFLAYLDQQQLAWRPLNLPKVRYAVTYDDGTNYPASGSDANIWPIRFKNIKRDLPRGNGNDREMDFWEFPRDDGPEAVDDWAFAFDDKYIEPDTLLQVVLLNETWVITPSAAGEIVTVLLLEDIPPRSAQCYGLGTAQVLNKTRTNGPDGEEVREICEQAPTPVEEVTVANPRCTTFYEGNRVHAYLNNGVYEILDEPCNHYVGTLVRECQGAYCEFQIPTPGGVRTVNAFKDFGTVEAGAKMILNLACQCQCEICDNCIWVACCRLPGCFWCPTGMPLSINVRINADCFSGVLPNHPSVIGCGTSGTDLQQCVIPVLDENGDPVLEEDDNGQPGNPVTIDVCSYIQGHNFTLQVSEAINTCCWNGFFDLVEELNIRQIYADLGGDPAQCDNFLSGNATCGQRCHSMLMVVCVGEIDDGDPFNIPIYGVTASLVFFCTPDPLQPTIDPARYRIDYWVEVPGIGNGTAECKGTHTLPSRLWGLTDVGTCESAGCMPTPVNTSTLTVVLEPDENC